MPRPLLIFSQSDYLIQIVAINSHTKGNSAEPDQLASSNMSQTNETLIPPSPCPIKLKLYNVRHGDVKINPCPAE